MGPAALVLSRRHKTWRRGSILVVVVWLLVACSILVFAAQREARQAEKDALARFQRDAAAWAATGAVYYSAAWLASYEPEPGKALQAKPDPDFHEVHKADEPIGWFVAPRPHPTNEESRQTRFCIVSEQSRMNLNALTTSAVEVLLPGEEDRQQFLEETSRRREEQARRRESAEGDSLAARPTRTSPGEGSEPAEEMPLWGHPLELLTLEKFRLSSLMGQDWNDNYLLDPHEQGRRATTPERLKPRSGPRVDRGIVDLVTTWTDGKLDPYEAEDLVLDAFLGEHASKAEELRAVAKDRPEPASLAPTDGGWADFCKKHLTRASRFFRVQTYGTLHGEPIARVTAILEATASRAEAGQPAARAGEDKKARGFRALYWRSDG